MSSKFQQEAGKYIGFKGKTRMGAGDQSASPHGSPGPLASRIIGREMPSGVVARRMAPIKDSKK